MAGSYSVESIAEPSIRLGMHRPVAPTYLPPMDQPAPPRLSQPRSGYDQHPTSRDPDAPTDGGAIDSVVLGSARGGTLSIRRHCRFQFWGSAVGNP